MDGCADVGGCLEAPFAIMELCSRGKGGGFIAVLAVLVGVGLAVGMSKNPEPPKPSITERAKDAIGHPINRWKIERAEKKYWEQQRKKAETAPINTTNKPRIRDRVKDWMRDKLNEDYKKRHPEENK